MANILTNAIARASKKGHPYATFVIPQIRISPWVAPMQSHGRDAKYRREISDREIANASAQKVSLEAWILYMIRFVFTFDICNDWVVCAESLRRSH